MHLTLINIAMVRSNIGEAIQAMEYAQNELVISKQSARQKAFAFCKYYFEILLYVKTIFRFCLL